ncbi:MAG: hydrogenase iron-sulfur subunit [Spirochaetes bacterium]|nr:hydrogenase iron-sulfur subunit [Spirochaetota bacterium]
MSENSAERFEPKIIAYVCNWCTYAGADLTGTSRIKYASNVRIIKLPCTGRIDFMLLLKAFMRGADGIIVSGCHPNDCHYTAGNFHARRRWMVFGFDTEGRIHFAWVSAAEGAKWAELVNSVTEQVRKLGPFSDYKNLEHHLIQSEGA